MCDGVVTSLLWFFIAANFVRAKRQISSANRIVGCEREQCTTGLSGWMLQENVRPWVFFHRWCSSRYDKAKIPLDRQYWTSPENTMKRTTFIPSRFLYTRHCSQGKKGCWMLKQEQMPQMKITRGLECLKQISIQNWRSKCLAILLCEAALLCHNWLWYTGAITW